MFEVLLSAVLGSGGGSCSHVAAEQAQCCPKLDTSNAVSLVSCRGLEEVLLLCRQEMRKSIPYIHKGGDRTDRSSLHHYHYVGDESRRGREKSSASPVPVTNRSPEGYPVGKLTTEEPKKQENEINLD